MPQPINASKRNLNLVANRNPSSWNAQASNIYVNIPDLKQIAVINRNTKEITHWPLSGLRLNFPMALDKADHS